MSGREVWVYEDLRDERLSDLSEALLAPARALAKGTGASTRLVMVEGDDPCGPGIEAVEGAVKGADYITVLVNPALSPHRPDLIAPALADLIKERNPALVLFPLTDLGRELAARVSGILGLGVIADAESFEVKDGAVIAHCPAWGGRMAAEIYFSDPAKTGLVTVGHRGGAKGCEAGKPGEIERVEVKAPEANGIEVISIEPESAERRKLEDAETVVVGGAGLRDSDGFHLVRELAAALGAEVGATRPAVLSHWASEERLIGQTGKSIRPKLLFSVGTSGAIQYTAGIAESGFVVAINKDPDAHIFACADAGLVADARIILPLLIEKARQVSLKRLAELRSAAACREGGQKTGFGEQVRALREGLKLTADELAALSGSTPEFIGEVEAEAVTPSVAFLLRLARALKVDPDAFLTDRDKNELREKADEGIKKRTDNYSYVNLTPASENSRLRGFLITIEPRQAHKPVAYKHEGEEFIYVMEGELEVNLGGKTHHLKPLEHLHFNSETPHKLRSLSDQPTKCLVMLYVP